MGWDCLEQGSSNISRGNGKVFKGNAKLYGWNSIVLTGYSKLEWRFEDEAIEEEAGQHHKRKQIWSIDCVKKIRHSGRWGRKRT